MPSETIAFFRFWTCVAHLHMYSTTPKTGTRSELIAMKEANTGPIHACAEDQGQPMRVAYAKEKEKARLDFCRCGRKGLEGSNTDLR